MTTKFGQTSAGKAPAFFIPASYKGHLMNTPIITPKSTSGPLPSNHVTSPSRSNELGRMTDSYGQMGSTNDGNQPSGHTLGGLGITGNSGNKDSIANNVARLGSKQEESQQSSYLLASPGGVLDLSMYNFVPAHTKSPTPKGAKGKSGNGTVAGTNTAIVGENPTETMNLVDSEVATVQKEKKRRRFRRPRRNSKLDKLIRLLEDKRVGDDDENAEELEDLQMPRLRKVLNIIFVTLGVCFLLAVIIVIMYTTIATFSPLITPDSQSDFQGDALSDLCLHRAKPTDGCENHTVIAEELSSDGPNMPTTSLLDAKSLDRSTMQTEGTSRNLAVMPMQSLNPVVSQSVTYSDTDMLQQPPISSLHNPPDVSITGYQSIARPGSESLLPATYPYPNPDQFQPMYNAHDRVRQPYTWSNQRYSIDLNSGSIQEQLDTQNQWWPASDQSRSRKSYRLDSG